MRLTIRETERKNTEKYKQNLTNCGTPPSILMSNTCNGVSEAEEKEKGGRKNIWRNDNKLPKFDKNINLQILEA